MFKVDNKDTRTTPVVLVSLLLIFTSSSSVFIVNFEHVIAGLDYKFQSLFKNIAGLQVTHVFLDFVKSLRTFTLRNNCERLRLSFCFYTRVHVGIVHL